MPGNRAGRGAGAGAGHRPHPGGGLDALVTSRYRLDEVNQGCRDLTGGKNLRGVMIIDH